MILLAFLLPFSVYLLLLGIINRRAHPVLIPGVWDFVGILFAASGFLLVVGPAIISSSSESWRMFWLFGTRAGTPEVGDEAGRIWGPVAGLYFVFVVGGAIYLLRRRRCLTAVYNVDTDVFENALGQALSALNLTPIRSGGLLVFSQASRLEPSAKGDATVADPASRALLEVDPFRAMRHVTLRWEPAASPIRREVEGELERALSRVHCTNHAVGDWFVLLALAMLAFNLFATFGLTLSSFVRR